MRSFLLGCTAVVVAPSALAQLCAHDNDPPAALVGDVGFGHAVDLGARWAVVGAPQDDSLGIDAGAAAVYWLDPVTGRMDHSATLFASDGEAGDGFGSAVAVSGDVVAIGAPNDDDANPDAGAVYVFRHSTSGWIQEQKLVPSLFGLGFGASVDVDGDWIVAGRSGEATVFQSAASGTWMQEVAFFGPAGHLVAIDLPVVATSWALHRLDPVAASWVPEHSIDANHSLAIDGDLLAHRDGPGDPILLERRDPATGLWSAAGSTGLSPNDGPIALASGRLIVRGDSAQFPTVVLEPVAGSTSWTIAYQIQESGPGVDMQSADLAAVGDRVLAGFPRWHASAGRTYLHDLGCERAHLFVLCHQPVANSTGATGRLDATGSDVIADDDFTLVASLLPQNSFGFFLAARSAGFTPMAGGSQGTLCLGPSIGRFVGPGQIQSSGVLGRFELRLDLTSLPTPNGLVAAMAGDPWVFQAWHRDGNPNATSNFTDAVWVVFE